MEPIVHRVPRDPRLRGDGPSFLRVVIFSAVAVAIFFVIAWFVLHATGRDLLPPAKQTSHPHAMIRPAGPPPFRVA